MARGHHRVKFRVGLGFELGLGPSIWQTIAMADRNPKVDKKDLVCLERIHRLGKNGEEKLRGASS